MNIQPPKVWRKSKNFKELIGRTGTVLNFTKIHVLPASNINKKPYYVSLVELENGKKMTVQIADSEHVNLKTGAKVRLILRKNAVSDNGLIQYSIKAMIDE